MKNYTHFLFDIDGTLVDTERTCVESLQRTILELMGEKRPYDELYPYFGIPSSKVAGLLHYPDEDGFLHLWEENFVSLMHLMTVFPGVVEMLRALKAAGKYIGVVTSRTREEYKHDRNILEMENWLDFSVCAEDSLRHKPNPDPVLSYLKMASEALGATVRPEECIYIGDTLHDSQCAHGAGCDFAFIDWKGRGADGLDAEYCFRNASGILSLIR